MAPTTAQSHRTLAWTADFFLNPSGTSFGRVTRQITTKQHLFSFVGKFSFGCLLCQPFRFSFMLYLNLPYYRPGVSFFCEDGCCPVSVVLCAQQNTLSFASVSTWSVMLAGTYVLTCCYMIGFGVVPPS